jgi:mannose/fructose/N-acetylgalactosamine-specific phosphotransferase system component IIC
METTVSEIGVLIPLVAVFMGIGLAIVSVITQHRTRVKALEQRHRERMAAIEKGIELPPDLASDTGDDVGRGKKSAARYLLQGLICLGIGAALLVSSFTIMPAELQLPGGILVAIGAALVIFYVATGRTKPSALPGDPPR